MKFRAGNRRRYLAQGSLLGATLLFVLVPSRAVGLTWQASPAHFETFEHSAHQLLLHPSLDQWLVQPKGLALFGAGRVTFDEGVRLLLRDELGGPQVSTIATDTTPAAFGLGAPSGEQSIDYAFRAGGVPLCGFMVRAHKLSDGSAFILGSVPAIDAHETVPTDWPDQGLSADQAGRTLRTQTDFHDLRIGHSERCLYVANGKLLPVWQMNLYADGNPYIAFADAYETLKLDQNFFDAVDGTARAYPRNVASDSAATVAVTGLTGDGTLTSAYIQTVVPSTVTQAKQADEAFVYADTDDRFGEVQAYVHGAAHFAWFQGIGFQWYGPQPLQIKAHFAPNGIPNNALFTPGSTDDGILPSIQIDNGDGKILQNLVTDADVVSHEMGHHIVYKTLQTTSGESLVLHEGLADAFVFLRTGDPCLGRSICPLTSNACVTQGQCLRSGTLGVAYNDSQWNGWSGAQRVLGHKHGQLISGIIWDLIKTQGMSNKDVTALTFKAISYFKSNSGFCDFTASLFTAEKALFQGAHEAKLSSVLSARGMGPFLPTATPRCASLSTGSGIQDTSVTKDSSTQKKKGLFGCAVIELGDARVNLMWSLLLLAVPVVLSLRPTPARQRARRSSKRKT